MVAPASSVGSAVSCPKCGVANAAGARFCNACGASLAAPPAAAPVVGSPSAPAAAAAPASAPGTPPVDIRSQVDQDRGILKRLQMLVPGFRGYREGEDIRVADSMLRRQVADRLKNVRGTIENARSSLANAGQFQALNDLAPLVADLMRVEGSVRAAEQGYTGISPAVRIKPDGLDRLYEYDYGFAQAADQLSQTVAPLPDLAMAQGSAPSVAALLASARGQLSQLDSAFKARIQVIENVRVTE